MARIQTAATLDPAADPAAALHDDQDQDQDQDAPEPAEQPGRVLLSDGRVAVVRRTTGLDEERVEKRLARWDYGLDGLDAIAFGRVQVVFGLERLDGTPFSLDDEQGQPAQAKLDQFLFTEKVRHLIALQMAYDRLNGASAPRPAAPAGYALAPNEVALSTGHVARIREETGRDEQRRNRTLGDFGYTLAGVGQISHGRAAALMAVEAIDGQARRPIQTRAALDERLKWWASDILLIINLHARLNLGAGFRDELD